MVAGGERGGGGGASTSLSKALKVWVGVGGPRYLGCRVGCIAVLRCLQDIAHCPPHPTP